MSGKNAKAKLERRRNDWDAMEKSIRGDGPRKRFVSGGYRRPGSLNRR